MTIKPLTGQVSNIEHNIVMAPVNMNEWILLLWHAWNTSRVQMGLQDTACKTKQKTRYQD